MDLSNLSSPSPSIPSVTPVVADRLPAGAKRSNPAASSSSEATPSLPSQLEALSLDSSPSSPTLQHFKGTDLCGVSFPNLESLLREAFRFKKSQECVDIINSMRSEFRRFIASQSVEGIELFLFIEELLLAQIIELCVQKKQMDLAWFLFLIMRAQWYRTQHTIEARNLQYGQFNSPFQRAWRAYLKGCSRAPSASLIEHASSSLVPRKWIPVSSPSPSASSASSVSAPVVTVMTFNILADYLQSQFSFQHVQVPDAFDFLSWNYRREMIIEEIKRWNCDVVCLQEVDTEHLPWLSQQLSARCGLNGLVFSPRLNRNGKPLSDGEATFFNAAKWGLVDSQNMVFSDAEQAAGMCQIVSLQSLELSSPYGIVVSNIHTQAFGPSRLVRCQEVERELKLAMDKLKKRLQKKDVEGDTYADVHVGRVMTGDWNGLMPEDRAHFEEHGYVHAYNPLHAEAMESGTTPICTCHNTGFHWGGETDYLSCHSDALRPIEIVQIPQMEALSSVRLKAVLDGQEAEEVEEDVVHRQQPRESLPGPRYPSDHMSMVARFQFLQQS